MIKIALMWSDVSGKLELLVLGPFTFRKPPHQRTSRKKRMFKNHSFLKKSRNFSSRNLVSSIPHLVPACFDVETFNHNL